MKIFALETDTDRMAKNYLSADETIILAVRFHGFLFLLRIIRSFLLSLLLIGIGIGIWYIGAPVYLILIAVLVTWIPTVFYPLLTSYIDWKYDILLITTEKLVVINQSSLFHTNVRQMNLDNLASVNASTQCWNMVPFGMICFDLKEGIGQRFCLRYIPEADKVASIISNAVVLFQRRRAAMAQQAAHQPSAEEKKPS